jgi:hypothetical protein
LRTNLSQLRFSLELGVGLLIAGIVDVAVLSALHELIEGDTKHRKKAYNAAPNMD